MPTVTEIESWSDEKLRRKEDQAWDMAGLARKDGDKKDEIRHTAIAKQCAEEQRRRAE